MSKVNVCKVRKLEFLDVTMILQELSGSGRFQGNGGLIILKQRLYTQHVKQHLGVRSMTLATWVVSLDFLFDYYVLLCPGMVGTHV